MTTITKLSFEGSGSFVVNLDKVTSEEGFEVVEAGANMTFKHPSSCSINGQSFNLSGCNIVNDCNNVVIGNGNVIINGDRYYTNVTAPYSERSKPSKENNLPKQFVFKSPPSVQQVQISGAVGVDMESAVCDDTVSVDISGASSIHMDETKEFDLIEIYASGASSFSGSCSSSKVTANASGASSIKNITCIKSLKAGASGASSIKANVFKNCSVTKKEDFCSYVKITTL